eukprot:CAMPEP_0204211054 /NCGR_PEP_ID=MMETSP0361-20130328/74360_1 /ASSEMBLY_ACC=CAM_ASM_000343 /TAXON_ID=268821 /ORGANISM="Scrippsiella Hangoei, Strain SHTV-5" /LENGTH=43 /DNA_ID= /DNA_START= /DNA_END= /DNA_ORIENTATION=
MPPMPRRVCSASGGLKAPNKACAQAGTKEASLVAIGSSAEAPA